MAREVINSDLISGLYHPKFPSHWQQTQLYSLAQWVNGLAFRDIHFSETGKPIIKISEVKDGISSQTKRTKQTFDESVHVRNGDLLFSWSGQPETSIDAFWWRGIDGWLNQHLFRVTSSPKVGQSFLYYLLKYLKPNFVGIARNKQTTGLGHVTKRDLESLEVAYPESFEEQRALAHILGTFDDKIELNRQINWTLDEMAQAIFKSWFVDFEPVKAKMEAIENGEEPERTAMRAISGKSDEQLDALPREQFNQLAATAALFPSFLTDSPLGPIPEGWSVKSLDQIANYQNGLALQKFRPENEDEYLPVVKIAQLKKGFADGEEKASPNIRPDCIIDNGDIVFSWSGSLMVDVWCGGKAALNQHLFKVTSDTYPKWFYYEWTKHHLAAFQQIASDKAVTMGHIKRSHLEEALCAVPNFDFDGPWIIGDLLDAQIQRRLECLSLETMRDALLPKLLSGEISIGASESELEEVA